MAARYQFLNARLRDSLVLFLGVPVKLISCHVGHACLWGMVRTAGGGPLCNKVPKQEVFL